MAAEVIWLRQRDGSLGRPVLPTSSVSVSVWELEVFSELFESHCVFWEVQKPSPFYPLLICYLGLSDVRWKRWMGEACICSWVRTHLFVVFLSKDRGQIPTQIPRIPSGNVTYEDFGRGFTVS